MIFNNLCYIVYCSESDIHMLEALKSQDLLILGTEDEADTEEDPGESLSKFQNVIEQFIEQNSPETSKSTADHDVPSRSSKNSHVNALFVKMTFI